jgi:SsrA-binding protein
LREFVEQKGHTLVPLSLYMIKGRVKVELGVCKGKAEVDKRETLRRRESDRDAERAISQHYRG